MMTRKTLDMVTACKLQVLRLLNSPDIYGTFYIISKSYKLFSLLASLSHGCEKVDYKYLLEDCQDAEALANAANYIDNETILDSKKVGVLFQAVRDTEILERLCEEYSGGEISLRELNACLDEYIKFSDPEYARFWKIRQDAILAK